MVYRYLHGMHGRRSAIAMHDDIRGQNNPLHVFITGYTSKPLFLGLRHDRLSHTLCRFPPGVYVPAAVTCTALRCACNKSTDTSCSIPLRIFAGGAQPLTMLLAFTFLFTLATAATITRRAASDVVLRPRIYIYDLPPHLLSMVGGIGHRLVEQIKLRGYHETDGDKADYFWIPGGGQYVGSEGKTGVDFVTSVFEHIRSQHPWWNMTVALGQARHVLVVLYDAGVGEAFGFPGHAHPNTLPPGASRPMHHA